MTTTATQPEAEPYRLDSASQEDTFARIVRDKTTGDEESTEFIRILEDNGLFDDDPGIARAVESYKARKVRHLARKVPVVDRFGRTTELVNVVRLAPDGQTKTHRWVQLSLLGFEDQVKLVKDRIGRADYFTSEAARFFKDGVKKHGAKFRKEFPLGLTASLATRNESVA